MINGPIVGSGDDDLAGPPELHGLHERVVAREEPSPRPAEPAYECREHQGPDALLVLLWAVPISSVTRESGPPDLGLAVGTAPVSPVKVIAAATADLSAFSQLGG